MNVLTLPRADPDGSSAWPAAVTGLAATRRIAHEKSHFVSPFALLLAACHDEPADDVRARLSRARRQPACRSREINRRSTAYPPGAGSGETAGSSIDNWEIGEPPPHLFMDAEPDAEGTSTGSRVYVASEREQGRHLVGAERGPRGAGLRQASSASRRARLLRGRLRGGAVYRRGAGSPGHRLMSLTRLDLWSVLLGACVLHWCWQAVAEESDAARLFREGRALVVDGRFAEACPKLEQSQRLEPRLGTQLNIAFCHEQLGKLATAWSGFQEAASTARREGDLDAGAVRHGAGTCPRAARALARRACRRGRQGGDPPTILLDGAPLAPRTLGQGAARRSGVRTSWSPGTAARSTPARSTGGRPWCCGSRSMRTSPSRRRQRRPPSAHRARRSRQCAHGQPLHLRGGRVRRLIAVDTRQSTPVDDPASIQAFVHGRQWHDAALSCATVLCDYPSIGASSGFVVGVAGFVGYAVAEQVGLGLRLLLGPRLGGGALVAFGPSASVLLCGAPQGQPGVLFGTASHVELDTVTIPTPTGFNEQPAAGCTVLWASPSGSAPSSAGR